MGSTKNRGLAGMEPKRKKLRKRDIVFYFDLSYVVAALAVFCLLPAVDRPGFIQFLTGAIMPVISVLSAGISVSIFAEKNNGGDNGHG